MKKVGRYVNMYGNLAIAQDLNQINVHNSLETLLSYEVVMWWIDSNFFSLSNITWFCLAVHINGWIVIK